MTFNQTNKRPQLPEQSKLIRLGIIAFVVVIIFMMLSNTTFLTIDPGEKGVVFKRFGGGLEKDKIYSQGFHVILPWNKMFIYDVRINEGSEELQVLSKNGLSITIDLTYRFAPQAEKIGFLHDEIGPNYINRILKPEVRSATREIIGKYLPEELYSTKKEAIQDEIFQATKAAIEPKHITLDAILIKSVELPKTLTAAIEKKLEEEQLSFQYEFKLDRERKEAERKIIEAQAKADANRILNQSLSDKLLKDKGIEATMELANSPNSKVVVIGGSGDGLPLILNN